METLADLLAMPGPEPTAAMGRPKHDENPDDRRRHVALAVDRVIRGMSLAECQARYRLASRQSVYNYINFAIEYDDDPMSAILRRVVNSRKSA